MASDELTERASEAPAARRLRDLVEWVGEGRPLTQTGRLDQRTRSSSSSCLGPATGSTSGREQRRALPAQPGGRVGEGCRLVRVARGRLLPVKKAGRLLERRLELVVRALEALPGSASPGRLGRCVRRGPYRRGGLRRAPGAAEASPIERACEVAWKTATARYWFAHPTEHSRMAATPADVRRVLESAADLGVLTIGGAVELTTSAVAACPSGSASERRRPAR